MLSTDLVLAMLTALHRHNLMQCVLERTNYSFAGALLYGRTRSLLELAGNALHVTLLRVVRSIQHPGD